MKTVSIADQTHTLDVENKYLKHTIVALREELEKAKTLDETRVQQAIAQVGDEQKHMRATIRSLREELEQVVTGREEFIQQAISQTSNQSKQ